MRMRNLSLFALLILPLILCGAVPAGAAPYNVTLRSNRQAVLANSKDSADLIAEVRDPGGRPVNTNVEVQFQTTLGTLSQSRAQTFGGAARVRLTSAITGVAKVTATLTGSAGGVSQPLEITFTDDPEATFMGNNYMSIAGNSYLAYSATDEVIEAQGKDGGARVVYRNIEITADRFQLRCKDNIVRAHNNITLKRGKNVLKATRLYYSLQSGQGYAMTEKDNRLQLVFVSGENLRIQPLENPIPNSYLLLPALQVKLIIVSRGITYFPGDRLQFRRPKYYQDQALIMSLPYSELQFGAPELFSDQFFSVGTSGFGLELPFYYNLTPRSTGIFYLRHQQQLGRGYFSTSPGWSVDVIQGYSAQGTQRYEGQYGFTGLTRGDWGFRWSHNHEFNSDTQGTFYLDFPQHNSVYSTANFNQQSRRFRWGANLAGGQTFISPVETSYRGDVYFETQPRTLRPLKDIMYTLGTDFTSGRSASSDPIVGTIGETAEQVTLRGFTRPLPLDSRTTLTNSFSVGHVWTNQGRNGLATLATLSLDHTVPGGGSLSLSYDFVNQPSGAFVSSGRHRLGLNYNLVTNKRFQVSLFGSAFLDAPDASFLADVAYRLDKNWRLMAAATLQRFDGQSYHDIEVTLGRRIGARELQLTYSTFYKRISLDFTATRF